MRGPQMAAAQNAILRLKVAAYRLRNQLGMPVPMPYFHSLAVLQNINFAIYSYALCSFQSFMTPIILFVVILITVGMRGVAVALSNPYGKDDVDFPVNKWVVAQLRAMALIVHPENYECLCPNISVYTHGVKEHARLNRYSRGRSSMSNGAYNDDGNDADDDEEEDDMDA